MNKAKPLRLKPTPGRSVHDDPVLDRNGTYDGLIYTHGPIEQQIAYHNSQIQNFLSKCAKYASEGKPSMSSLLLLRDNILGLEKTIDVIIKLGMKTYINYEDVVEEYHKLQEALESKEQVPTQEEMASLIERNDPMVLSLPKLNSWKDLSIQIVEHEHEGGEE